MRLIIPSLIALALAAPASAATVTVTAQYFSLTPTTVQSGATPDIIALAPDGNPVIDNQSAFFGGLGQSVDGGKELLWWSNSGPTTALSGITPINNSTATQVNVSFFRSAR